MTDAQGGHKNISKYRKTGIRKWARISPAGYLDPELAPQKTNRGKGNFYEDRCHLPMIARRSDAVRVRDDVVTLTDVNAILPAPTSRQVPDYTI